MTQPRPQVGDEWYRYESSHHMNEGMTRPGISIYLQKYNVIKILPASVRIEQYGFTKVVLINANKRFAYPTRELAFNSFLKRCRWRSMYAERAHFVAEKLLLYVEGLAASSKLPSEDITNFYKGY